MTKYENRRDELAEKLARAWFLDGQQGNIGQMRLTQMRPLAEIALAEMAEELRTEKKLHTLLERSEYTETDKRIDEAYLKQLGLVP